MAIKRNVFNRSLSVFSGSLRCLGDWLSWILFYFILFIYFLHTFLLCLELKSCAPLSTPANGTLHGSATSHGAKASFSCSTGFDLFGSPTLTCSNGVWNAITPTCKGSIASYLKYYLLLGFNSLIIFTELRSSKVNVHH